MKEIRMVDLKTQYENIRSNIDTAINNVLESTQFIRGVEVGQFEDELADYLGTKHVISCGNGTDALQIALMSLGLNPGDEVITTDFTFIATIEVIALLGLKPVLVDPQPGSFNIDPAVVEKAITNKTRAIIPVHLFGQCANMKEIMSLARRHNLYVVEDTAQATGADYYMRNDKDISNVKAGTIGNFGCTSFFPSKNLGCYGDGGALFTNDDNLASLARSIANHGMTRRYWHDHIGVNSRLDTLQAAILSVKLKRLDQYNAARQDVAAEYDRCLKNLPGVKVPERNKFSSHIFHQYTLRVDQAIRDKLRDFLSDAGIPSMVYYPVPLHRQDAYRFAGFIDSDFPVTNSLSSTVISLPIHTELEKDQIEYICSTINKFFSK